MPSPLQKLPMRSCFFVLLGVVVAASSAHADTVSYADSTNPLAFFALQSQSQGSTVNGYTTTYNNGASTVPSNGGPQPNAVSLNGDNSSPQYVSTSLFGGVNGAGSISAYINLAAGLNGGQVEYIAGESQVGNDLDLQLVNSSPGVESLCFYTDAGSSTCGNISDSSLVGSWNMVTATYDSSTGNQDLYLDGTLLASNNNGTPGLKVDQFTIGYSTVFGSRDFDGDISDVGIWDYQLTGTQVLGLYDAASSSTPPSSTPEPSSLALLGTGILGAAGAFRRRIRR